MTEFQNKDKELLYRKIVGAVKSFKKDHHQVFEFNTDVQSFAKRLTGQLYSEVENISALNRSISSLKVENSEGLDSRNLEKLEVENLETGFNLNLQGSKIEGRKSRATQTLLPSFKPKRINLDVKEEVYAERAKVNDALKEVRKILKLPKHSTDLLRIKKAIREYSEGKHSLNKLFILIELTMHDKFFEGVSSKFYKKGDMK